MLTKPKKSLGQNFLIDKNILQKIVNIVSIYKNKEILEIGPGTGNLTHYLVKKKLKLMLNMISKLIFSPLHIKICLSISIIPLFINQLNQNSAFCSKICHI